MKNVLLLLSISGLLIGCATTSQDENLKVFTSEKYAYEFSYPSTVSIHPNDMFTEDNAVNSADISVVQEKVGDLFTIKVYANTNQDLKKHVEKLWTLNKEGRDANDKPIDKNISKLEKTDFNNIEAYKFTLENSFDDDEKSGYVLDAKNAYIFTENNNLIYEIHFPSENEKSRNIFESFKLLYK